MFPGMFLLLIPLIIALGYGIRVAGETVKGNDNLPEFNRWRNLFIKGLGGILINVVYTVFVILLLLPAIICFMVNDITYNPAITILGFILLLIVIIPVIVLSIMRVISFVKYGEEGDVGAAFKFKEIYRNLRANLGKYIIGIILLFVLSAGVEILIVVFFGILPGLSIMPGYGEHTLSIPDIIVMSLYIIIILPLIGIALFYCYLIMMRMFAQIYKESKEKLDKSVLSQETETTDSK